MQRTPTGARLDGPAIGQVSDRPAALTVTPGFSNAAGAWTEVVASTTSETHWVELFVQFASLSGQQIGCFLDIGLGAAASEVAIVSSVAVGMHARSHISLPVRIPAGSRVSVRMSSTHATQPGGPNIKMMFFKRRPDMSAAVSPSTLTPIGAGTNVGTLINSNNAWIQITAATAMPYRGLIPVVQGRRNTFGTNTYIDVEVGVGASGSEVVVASLSLYTSTNEEIFCRIPTVFLHIPAGTRLAVRGIDASSNYLDIVPLMIPYS